ncbi:unnamed protein product [Brassica oleracea var. botrytis]
MVGQEACGVRASYRRNGCGEAHRGTRDRQRRPSQKESEEEKAVTVQGDTTEETDESNRSNKSSNAAPIFTLDPLEGPEDEKDGSGDEDEEQKRL